MRPFILTIYLFVSTARVLAQNDIIINQYSQAIFPMNASYSSLAKHNEANIYYKKLWSGFSDSPEFSQFVMSGPVKNRNIGLGLNLNRQQSGMFSYVNAQGSLSYRVKLNEKNDLSFALQAGIKRLQINFSKINALHPDEIDGLPSQQASTVPTADFSLSYKRKTLLVFLSANQLLGTNFYYGDATHQRFLSSQVVPHYLVGLTWDKTLRDEFTNLLTVIARSHQGLPVQMELSDVVTWNSRIGFGLGYRQSYSGFALLRIQMTNDLLVGYSYEYQFNQLNVYSRGGHELNLSYRFGTGFKSNESSKKPSSKVVNELYEQLDKVDQKLEVNTKRVDTLDRNVRKLNEEFNVIKDQSLDQTEIKRLVDSLKSTDELTDRAKLDKKTGNSNNNAKRYGAIVNEEDAAKYKNLGLAKYNVVYGVYQRYGAAKDYVKLMLRDHAIDAELIQLNPSSNNAYVYVVDKVHKATLLEALAQLKTIRTNVTRKDEPVTNGLPWILVVIE